MMKSMIRMCLWGVGICCLSVRGLHAQQLLTLEACKEKALAQNKSIKRAHDQVEIAASKKEETDVSNKPTLSATGGGFYFGENLNSLLPEYGLNAMLSMEQTIYAGGRVRSEKQVAQKTLEIRQEQERLQRIETIYETEEAYWNLVASSEKVDLANQYKDLLDTLYEDLNNSYQAGLSYKNDLLQVQVQQTEAELNNKIADDNLVIAKMYLSQLIGEGTDTDFAVVDSVGGTFNEVLAYTDMDQALADRSEIRVLESSIETSRIQEKIYRAEFKPSIGLSVNGLYAAGPGINFSDQSNQLASYYSMLNISFSIFDWGQRKQKVKQQVFNTSSSQTALANTKELVTIEIRKASMQLNQSALRVKMSEEALTQADENLKLSSDRFKAGTIAGKDVLEAQVLWQQTYSDLIDARVAYKINTANLTRVLGKG